MEKNYDLVLDNEQASITKFIFKGLTIKEISEKLVCSTSTVSYKLNKLFKKHSVNSRREFIYKIIGKIIEKNSKEIIRKNKLLDEIRIIIKNLCKYKEDTEKFAYWEEKAKQVYEKINI